MGPRTGPGVKNFPLKSSSYAPFMGTGRSAPRVPKRTTYDFSSGPLSSAVHHRQKATTQRQAPRPRKWSAATDEANDPRPKPARAPRKGYGKSETPGDSKGKGAV
jgi:hypothetical protein